MMRAFSFGIFFGVVGLSIVLGNTASADPKWYLAKKHRDRLALQIDFITGPTGWFNQVIDHAHEDGAKFKQRFWIDSSLAKGEDAPVIYYICGEGACDGASTTTIVNQMAEKYGAHRVALEHRYYGESQPFPAQTAQNLRYLSMTQALEDLAAFEIYAKEKYSLKGKWVAVGGSYPGELAAFYRLKHPELISGSLASSAPVIAKADFEEYDRHVAKVAGASCLRAIQTATLDAEQKLKSQKSAEQIKKIFKLSQLKSNFDFLYVMADMAAVAIQYGGQKSFCRSIVNAKQGGLLEAYAQAGIEAFRVLGVTPYEDSFQAAESTDPKKYANTGFRAWMYQSCTEFGFFQTAYHVPAQSSRSTQINLKAHYGVCKRLFNLDAQVNLDRTNDRFYRELGRGSVNHIFFTNGSNDPWSNLSITDSERTMGNRELKFFLIPGAAHCDDLGTRVSDGLDTARKEFKTLMKSWLGV